MRHLIVAVVALLMLVGCAGSPEEVTSPTNPEEGVTSYVPLPTPGLTESAQPIDTYADLVCEPPTEGVLQWLTTTYNLDRFPVPASEVAMVRVGPGNNPEEIWWVVAVVTWPFSEGPSYPLSFLTNSPSGAKPSGERWINVAMNTVRTRSGIDWSPVNWDGERLARGKAAQAKALSCLPSSED
jgi:hypothetical protein